MSVEYSGNLSDDGNVTDDESIDENFFHVINEKERELENLKKEERKNIAEALVKKNKEFRNQISNLKRKLEESNQTNVDLRSRLEKARAEVKEKSEININRERHIQELEKKVRQFSTENASRIESLQKAIEVLNTPNSNKILENDRILLENGTLQENLDEKEEKLRELTSEHERNEKFLKGSKKEILRLKNKLSEYKNQVSGTEELQLSVDTLSREKTELQVNLKRISTDMESATSISEVLRKELKEASEKEITYIKNIAKLKEEIDRWRALSTDFNRISVEDASRLKRELDSKSLIISENKKKSESLDECLKQFENDSAEQGRIFEVIRTELKREINTLNESLSMEKSKALSLEKEVDLNTTRLNSTEGELRQKLEEIEELKRNNVDIEESHKKKIFSLQNDILNVKSVFERQKKDYDFHKNEEMRNQEEKWKDRAFLSEKSFQESVNQLEERLNARTVVLERQVNEKEDMISRKDILITENNSRMKKQASMMENMKTELDMARNDLVNEKNSILRAKSAIRELESEKILLQRNLENTAIETEKQRNETIVTLRSQLEARIRELENSAQRSKSQLAEKDQRIQNLELALSSIRNVNNSLQRRINVLNTTGGTGDTRSLSINALVDKLEEKTKALDEVSKKVERIPSQFSLYSHVSKNEELKSIISEMRKEMDNLLNEKANTSAIDPRTLDTARLIKTMREPNDEESSAENRKKSESQKQQLENLTKENNTRQKNNINQAKEISILRQQLRDYKNAALGRDNSILEENKELKNIISKMQKFEENLDKDVQQENIKLRLKIGEVVRERDRVEHEKEKLLEISNVLKKEIMDKDRDKDSTISLSSVSDVATEKDLSTKLTKIERSIKNLQSQNKSLKSQLRGWNKDDSRVHDSRDRKQSRSAGKRTSFTLNPRVT